jgi:hypothetical protein
VKRAIAMILALSVSGVLGVGFAFWSRPETYLVTAEQLAPTHEAEEALATQAGLEMVDHGTSSEALFERELPLEAEQCVAVIATLAGPVRFASAELTVGTRTLESVPFSTRLVHLAACSSRATTVHISLRPDASETPGAPSALRFSILRGFLARPHDYVRLSVTLEDRLRFDAAAVRAREERSAPANEQRIGTPVLVTSAAATVFPPSHATFGALRALVGRAGVVPSVDVASADPFALPDERTIPPRVLTSTGSRRVLAVVDAGAVAESNGVGCISITLARLDDPREAVPITRIAVPSQVETQVAPVDGAIAIDRLCPADGLFVYVVEESAGGEYLVALRGVGGSVGTPRASTFGAPPRRGPALITRLPVLEVATAIHGCEAGNRAACMAWSELAFAGLDGAGDARVPLEHACTLEDASACDRLAAHLAGDAEATERFERRACELGHALACLRRAARHRDAGRFVEAHATYRYGCAHGCTECCAGAATMEEWQLASAVTGASALP